MHTGIELHDYLIVLAIVAFAYFVRGLASFGSGLIAIPLLLVSGMPLDRAVPVIAVLDYIASASHGLQHRRAISWPAILPILPFVLIGVLAALYLFKTVDLELLTRALAVFLILFALHQLLARVPHRSDSRLWAVPAGGFAGLIGTLFGTGGPFYVVYLQLRGLDKTAFRASLATAFLIDGANRIGGYTLSGILDLAALKLVGLLLPVMAIGLYVGGHLHVRISEETFKRGISILLIGSGIVLLLR